MDFIKEKLSSFGLLIAGFGLISMILNFLNYELRVLIWIDNWGTTTGWIIRIGLVVIGGALFLLAGSNKEELEETE